MRIALAVTLVLLLAPAAWCQVSIGGAQSLYVQPSARAAGMGHCTIAVLDDASASSWNPGGLAFMQGDISISGVYSQLLPDWEDVIYKYGAAAVRVMDVAVVGVSVMHLSYGEQVATTPDDPDPFTTFEPYELIRSVAVGAAIGEHVGVGVNLKHVKVDLARAWDTLEGQSTEGTTFAVDFGVEGRTEFDIGDLGLLVRAGGAIQHDGEDVEYIDAEHTDPLPKSVRLGASGQLSHGKAGHVLLCGQYAKSVVGGFDNDRSWVIGFGGELQVSILGLISQMEGSEDVGIRDLFTWRMGYVDDEDAEVDGTSRGFSVGVELDDRVLLSLDYAKVPQPEGLKEPRRLGVSGWFAF